MFKERNIPFIAQSEKIDRRKHLNESKLHLNHDSIKFLQEIFQY